MTPNQSTPAQSEAEAPLGPSADVAKESQGDRSLTGWTAHLATGVAVCYALFHIWTAGFGAFPSLIQRSLHVCFALVLVYLLWGGGRWAQKRVNLLDWACIAVAVVSAAWVWVGYDRFMERQDASLPDLIIGGALILVIMEAARRVIGVVFTVLAAAALCYAYFGRSIPMPFTHRGMEPGVIIDHLFLTDMGIWGVTTNITATVVAIFIIFGSVLLFSGGGQAFMNLALLIAGRATGGPAKVAVVASSLFATVSGSAAANVAVTGTFSIPMMRRLGYDRNFASATEATASTGGQLMPPIMGAGAFIMAELLAVPYVQVMLAAVIPCLLFYVGVFASVHLESRKRNYAPLDRALVPTAREVFAPAAFLPFLVPIAVLLGFLYLGFTPQRAGFSAVVTAVVLYTFIDLRPDAMRQRLLTIWKGLELAGYALVMIAVLAATAQIIIGIIGLTGLGVRLSSLLIAFSGGELLPALLMAMIVAIVLGMGMPTTGAYLVAASVLAPALTRIGMEPLQAHMFIFYFAILSAITPPVCAAVFVASGIAQSPWFRSALVAVRLGLVGFIVPFMFAYEPALLMRGDALSILLTLATALIGVLALAGGMAGRFLSRNAWWEGVVLVAAALMTIHPDYMLDLAGLAVIAAVCLRQLRARAVERAVERTAEGMAKEAG